MIFSLTALTQPPHLQGFGSAAQVPASYFKRRKRLRVRIAKVVEAAVAPPTRDGPPMCGRSRSGIDGKRSPEVGLEDNALGGETGWLHQGSDGG